MNDEILLIARYPENLQEIQIILNRLGMKLAKMRFGFRTSFV